MKLLLLVILLSFNISYAENTPIGSSSLNSNQTIKISVELSLDGKLVSSPIIITRLNSLASITQKKDSSDKELYIEVVPNVLANGNEENIQLKFKIGQKSGGIMKWLSSPQILAKNDQSAEISVHNNSNTSEYKDLNMKVTPSLQ